MSPKNNIYFSLEEIVKRYIIMNTKDKIWSDIYGSVLDEVYFKIDVHNTFDIATIIGKNIDDIFES